MCGLVGLAGNINIINKDIFTEMLIVDVVRGHHSTGVAAIRRNEKEPLIAKAPMPSPYFTNTQIYNDLINEKQLKCLIGHNRYATVGEKTVENSHPFGFDKVVGAHNGTLDSWALKYLEGYENFGTDSEALYNSINNRGLKESLNSITGAWALTYYDIKDNTINLIRNNKRPLYYAYSDNRETLYWASEADMLEWILKRNKIKIYDGSVYLCEEDTHYRWALPKFIMDKFEKPLISIVEGKTWPKMEPLDYEFEGYGVNYYSRGHRHNTSALTTSVSTPNNKPLLVANPKKLVATKKFRPPYKDAYGKIINKVEFEKLVVNGCVFCDESNSKWGDFIHPLKDDMDGRKLYLCEACYNEPEILELIENNI